LILPTYLTYLSTYLTYLSQRACLIEGDTINPRRFFDGCSSADESSQSTGAGDGTHRGDRRR